MGNTTILKIHSCFSTPQPILLFILLFYPFILVAQVVGTGDSDFAKVEPPHWWIGMHNEKLQLLVHAKDISTAKVKINAPGVRIEQLTPGNSNNYLFIDLTLLNEAEAGIINLDFYQYGQKLFTYPYELKKRSKDARDYEGFNATDAIYLITPDRFANANPKNDTFPTLAEKRLDRKDDYARHGGDIQGIIDHLEYIDEMGFTALWSSPLLINDMPEQSYHGYAITDLYQVDPRFGTLEEYKSLAVAAHKKGIKLIMDQVANHCGLNHWWMNDLPFKDWVNYQAGFEQKKPITTSNHRRTTNQDPYASQYDKALMNQGWFVPQMPDLNQKNPFLATYLIQNSIWWIETLGLGGIRQDTYPYPDKAFMARWAGAIMNEYPNFSIVGEEWSYNPLLIAYWQDGKENKDGYRSNLTHSMDFALQKALQSSLTNKEAWDKGLIELYEALANDFAYAEPKRLMAFLDNHDMDRAYTQYGEDTTLFKMALSTLLVLPRVPQIYYGTEILLENTSKPHDHGLIRTDFPGGWKGDTINGFTGNGLNGEQSQMKGFVKTLLQFRKKSRAIHEGSTIHFAPFEGIYVLFKQHHEETLMLILNKNTTPVEMDLSRFNELNLNGSWFKNILGKEKFQWKNTLQLRQKGAYLFSSIN
ncbi:MAG: glycoside hydrolase family 13 protein [Flavobacteriaceae bacterium]